MYRAYSNLFVLPQGPHNREATCTMRRAINTCPSREAKIGAWLQLVDGGGEQGKGRGISQCLLHSKKIISPSSATFPGRRGSNQAFSLPL